MQMKALKCLFLIMFIGLYLPLSAQRAGNSNAHVAPLAMQYFQNQYLANPAMAGIDTGLHVNLAYRKLWSGIPGSPVTKALTADYRAFRRVGFGVQVNHESAGLLSSTRVAGSYAYHLPLNHSGNSALHFGISAVFYAKYLDSKALNGDPNDPSIGEFNRRDNYFESDFGMAWTYNGFTLQGALPDMISLVQNKKEDKLAGRNVFFGAAAYRFEFPESRQINSIEPKVCLRGIQDDKSIVDIGANITGLNNWVNLFGLYHTSGNFTAGVGVHYKATASLQVAYTSQTSGLRNYADGGFQVSARIGLLK